MNPNQHTVPASTLPGIAQLGDKIRTLAAPVVSLPIAATATMPTPRRRNRNTDTPRRKRGRPRKVVEINPEHVKAAKSLPRQFGCKNMRETIKYIVKLTHTRLRAEVTDQKREAIIHDLAAGKSAAWVARRHGVSIPTVHIVRNQNQQAA